MACRDEDLWDDVLQIDVLYVTYIGKSVTCRRYLLIFAICHGYISEMTSYKFMKQSISSISIDKKSRDTAALNCCKSRCC